jgi:hypothetical protein
MNVQRGRMEWRGHTSLICSYPQTPSLHTPPVPAHAGKRMRSLTYARSVMALPIIPPWHLLYRTWYALVLLLDLTYTAFVFPYVEAWTPRECLARMHAPWGVKASAQRRGSLYAPLSCVHACHLAFLLREVMPTCECLPSFPTLLPPLTFHPYPLVVQWSTPHSHSRRWNLPLVSSSCWTF